MLWPLVSAADPVAAVPIPSVPIGPVPFSPTLQPPPLAAGPLGRGLSGAYYAIGRVRASDPVAAQRATGLYLQAQEQARRGDISGALASSALARAAAIGGLSAVPLAPAQPYVAPLASTGPVPLAGSTFALPPEFGAARDAIVRAERAGHGAALDRAKEQYRSGLDAYMSGDAERALRDVRAARDSARALQTKER